MGERIISLVVRHPLTWLALAVILACEGAYFSWFPLSLVTAPPAVALGLVALVLWPLIFSRSESFSKALYQRFEEPDAKHRAKIDSLAADLADIDFAKGEQQLRLIAEKFANLSQVIKRRLNAGELTYQRYLGMAEEVYLSALDNLHEIAVALRSISTIDPEMLSARLRELQGGEPDGEEAREEMAALEKRRGLYEEQKQRVARLTAQNETAMTVLDKTATALAGTKTGKGHANMDAKAAIAELERLAKQAKSYAVTD